MYTISYMQDLLIPYGVCIRGEEEASDPDFLRAQVKWNVELARKYICRGIAWDLCHPKVARPLEPGCYQILTWHLKLRLGEYRSSVTGEKINAIAQRVSDGVYVGVIDERVVWGNPEFVQPPTWSR